MHRMLPAAGRRTGWTWITAQESMASWGLRRQFCSNHGIPIPSATLAPLSEVARVVFAKIR
jgi:hypothetical protein